MRKLKRIIFSLLISAAMLTAATVAYADASEAASYGSEISEIDLAKEENTEEAAARTAENEKTTEGDVGGESTASESEGTSSTAGEYGETAAGKNNADSGDDNDTDVGNEYADEGFFTILYNECMEHADDIFAALAFIGTLIISVGYKKGLLPLLSRTTGTIREAVERARTVSSEQNADTRGALTLLDEKLTHADECIAAVNDGIKTLEEELGRLKASEDERRSLNIILRSQVDMLYDIFMSSAIPQYQKDAAGARICKMREELGLYELDKE